MKTRNESTAGMKVWIKVFAPHDKYVQASKICAIEVRYTGWHRYTVIIETEYREYVYQGFQEEANAQACAKVLREEIDSL